MQATATLTLRYVAPGDVASVVNFNAELEYVASAAGFLDVPEGTADGISYTVPFGSAAAAKGIVIKNNSNTGLEVSVNGSEDVFVVPVGSTIAVLGPLASGITGMTVTTTALTTADGRVDYIVLGDTPTP